MYKIKWISLIGNSGYIEPDEYEDEKTAQKDADTYNKLYPGVTHFVEEITDGKL